MDQLEKILKLFPVFSLLIITTSVINLIFYYGFYGVPIFEILEFGEVINEFFKNFLLLFVFFIFFVVTGITGVSYKYSQTFTLGKKFIAFAIFLFLVVIIKKTSSIETVLALFLIVVPLGLTSISLFIFYFIDKITANQFDKFCNVIISFFSVSQHNKILITKFIVAILVIVLMNIFEPITKYYLFQNSPSLRTTYLKTETEEYFNGDSYCIGRTSKYFIIYNNKTKIAKLIPADAIKVIEYRRIPIDNFLNFFKI
jgi:hypothetical protein